MSFWQQKIYPSLPVFTQNLAISVYGYFWHKRRFGGIFKEEVKGFLEREGFSAQQWRDYQTVQLRKLLAHAYQNVPLYRARYSKHGFSLSQLQRFEIEDLKKLPYLTKDDLRKFGTTTLLSTRREKGGQFFSSSGSTGTPTQILYSDAFHQRCNAFMEARVRQWAGVTGVTPRGMIGGRRIIPDASNRPPYFRYNFFERQTYFSAYHISLQNAKNYLDGMLKNGVEYMTGYAMSNYFLASHFEKLSFSVPELKAVITSSEKLTTEMRNTFYRVYGCRAFDSYSGVENCGLISESPEGELLASPDVGMMEIVDEKGVPVSPGYEGEVISTGFLNFDQPLIRYKIGDMVRLAENQKLSCGRSMPVIAEISGRTEDGIMTKDGRQMVRFHGIFINLPSVIEGQVVQHTYDSFSVNVVASGRLERSDMHLIITRMKSQLGIEVNIEVKQVEFIPRTSNGKFKAVISELK